MDRYAVGQYEFPMIISAIDLEEVLLSLRRPFSISHRYSGPTYTADMLLHMMASPNIDSRRKALILSEAHELHVSFQTSFGVIRLLVGFAS